MSKIFEALKKTAGDLEAVPTQLLEEAPPASVPAGGADAEQPRRAEREPSISGIRTLPLRVEGKAPLLPFEESHWTASEQYRITRTKILQHPRRPRLIVVSSSGPRDGKSVTAVNLAGALSLKSEARILLVDADFRRSDIHVQIGLPQEPGLADLLEGKCTLEEVLIRAEQFPNLYVIPAGSPRKNPAELLDSSRWVATCDTFRRDFGHVVVDSPPIAAVTDYDLIQAVCDGVILVARPDHTDRKLCLKAIETVPKEKFLGVIMNWVPDWFLARPAGYKSKYYYQPAHV